MLIRLHEPSNESQALVIDSEARLSKGGFVMTDDAIANSAGFILSSSAWIRAFTDSRNSFKDEVSLSCMTLSIL